MSLEEKIKLFKKWAKEYPGEWEYEYPDWGGLYESFIYFITHIEFEELSDRQINNLLYVIARDNECEYLVDELEEHPDKLIFLAQKAINSNENEAKWQLADRLGSILEKKEIAEKILLQFVKDSEEYVSRRALLALANMKSSFTEKFAIKAWESNHEYQRMAALWSLKKIDSSLINSYLDKAFQDGRENLVKNAECIINGTNILGKPL